ncbi:MAG: hypothetical protein ACTSPI_00045 [Candidatus Heimdallarchaeaceae archaeon]
MDELKLIEKTNWLDKDSHYTLRKYCLKRSITSYAELPKCILCSNTTPWNPKGYVFLKYCSECSSSGKKDAYLHELKKKTLMDNYGVINASQLETTKKTKLNKNKDLVEKTSWLDDTYPPAARRYCLENDIISIEKMPRCPVCNEITHWIGKGGRNFGVFCSVNCKMSERGKIIFNNKGKKSFKKNFYNIFIKGLKLKKIEPLFTKEDYINNSSYTFKCLRCNQIFESSASKEQKVNCPNQIHRVSSKYELEIKEWLSEITTTSIENNVKFYYDTHKWHELDIYIPKISLGIDFHGLYWHSNAHKEDNYHQNKYLFFKNKSIHFIQIFENEWRDKQEIVKSIIKSILNIYDRRLYARQSEIKEIDEYLFKEFLTENHLQGQISSSIKLGLFYNEELVAVQSFSKPRFSKQEEGTYELIRFCNKLNTVILGGFSKLLSYFEKKIKPKNIISYIDLRYFGGEGYYKNGFTFKHVTPPNYYYFKESSYILNSRMKFQKHKLPNILDNFDIAKTEKENMLLNNYYYIYDAGNLLLSKSYQ